MATKLERVTVTISSGAVASAAVTIPLDKTPQSIVVPSAMTGTSLRFEVSDDQGASYRKLYKEGTEYTVTIGTAEARHVALDPAVFRGVVGASSTSPTLLKVVSNASPSEAANRTLLLNCGIS